MDWKDVFTSIVIKLHHHVYNSASIYYSGKGLLDVVITEFPISMVGYLRMD
ncbi:MAG: hypothetical protein WBO91_02995 [Saprospiraceae bacterium]|nr:hypothetical protein [Candidatus Brachybacter algidus]MBK8843128.1 hypothetical protein [Candidatus Brachybacter algidus]